MSALARYFAGRGAQVSGYDRTPTSLTDELLSEGMDIHFEEDPGLIPPGTDLVIYTPAIPEENIELQQVREKGLPLLKRAEVLGAITRGTRTIAVAGTHGKTTTSTLIAHILCQAGIRCTAFLGGISKNYHSNYIEQGRQDEGLRFSGGSAELFVVEADEYDRSFLQLHPYIAVITSADPDHLDIYQDVGHLLDSFGLFASQTEPGGFLLLRAGLSIPFADPEKSTRYSYHVGAPADFHAEDLKIRQGLYRYNLVTPGGMTGRLLLGLPGIFNLENAVAASAVAWILGVPEPVLKTALSSYRGVKRRFDFQILREDLIYIDDYAHHPEELRACIQAVKDLYPGREITGVFQPHLYTRTRDLADGFAESLGMLDRLYLLDIYPAREKPIPGVTSAMLLDRIRIANKELVEKSRLIEVLKENRPRVLLTLGAGDIDQLVAPIAEAFGKE